MRPPKMAYAQQTIALMIITQKVSAKGTIIKINGGDSKPLSREANIGTTLLGIGGVRTMSNITIQSSSAQTLKCQMVLPLVVKKLENGRRLHLDTELQNNGLKRSLKIKMDCAPYA